MSKLLPETKLKEYIKTASILTNAKIENIEGIKYDFRISSRILKAKFHRPIDINNLSEHEKANIFVEPGEVVFVLTEEILNLPKDVKAILMPKRKMSHDGIMTLGGLSIDPLYKGRLLIGLYNFSSSPFPIIPGKKLIAAQFYKLEADEVDNFAKPEIEIDDFPDDLVRLMSRYNPVSASSLMDVIKTLEVKFEDIKKQFIASNDWFKQFQKSLDEQDRSIEKIIGTLDREVDDRKSKQLEIEKRMTDDYIKMTAIIQQYAEKAYKTAAIVGSIGALVVAFIVYAIQELLKHAGPVAK